MENVEFTRFIERYLDDKMQSSERRWFEKEMEGNLWLRKELELRRKANEIASNFDAVKLRAKLQKAEKVHRNTSAIEKAVKKVPVNYAAVFLGLIIISSLLILSGSKIDINSYTDKAADSYTASLIQRSGDVQIPAQLMKGMELYDNGKFSEAIQHFEILMAGENPHIQSSFMSGMGNLQIKEYNKAIKAFNIVIDQDDNMFLEDASYFLGLCYVNIEDTERARTILECIINSESRYKKDAKKILRSID